MARSTYRIKKWRLSRKDWRDYIIYLGMTKKRGGGSLITRIELYLSTGNVLTPENVFNAPDWFTVGEDFTLTVSGGVVINFVWNTDHWETVDEFSAISGTATLSQNGEVFPARYYGATVLGDFITAAASVKITAAAGVYITWSGN